MKIRAQFIAIAAVLVSTPLAAAQSLSVYPERMQLDHGADKQRIAVTLTQADGVTVDVTDSASLAVDPPSIANVGEGGILAPAADGEGTLTVKANDLTVSVPVSVKNASMTPPVSFRNGVEPALMRAGCNTGKCHGSAQGKNGFRLSLFGFDPEMDYTNLTRETRGRRLDASRPDESLMLLKPAGLVAHEGGEAIEKGSLLYETLRQWIAEGAQNDPPDLPSLTGIKVLPSSMVLEGEGVDQRLVVQASYSDGTDRDVTALAVMASADSLVVDVDGQGVVTANGSGETYVMARFGTFAVVSQVVAIDNGATPVDPPQPPANYVDEYVYKKHQKLRIAAAPKCSDEVFIRRAYIDVLGVLPTVEETRAFLSDEAPDKRAKLIDQLLDRPEFSEIWAMKWAEVLRVKSSAQTLDRKAMHRYNDWLRQAITTNKPINEIVTELLTAEGGNFSSPATNFYVVERDPTKIAENVAQVFMGVQMQCAQCHNHPFERWTMDDYYSFAAFFAQIGRKNSSDPREQIVFARGSGEVKNLKDGREMPPKFLGGAVPDVERKDRRAVLAEWLVSKENPWFAKNFANRVWAHFMGRGVVDPPDDVRTTNPPSNPELLDELSRRLVDYNYDFRSLVRDICNSNTYQMSTQPVNPALADERNFSVAAVRRLPAEQLLDGICSVSGTHVKFRSLPLGARAVQVADGNAGNYFLDVFGRPPRDSVCTCERRNEPTLAQTLHLINGPTITSALQNADGRLAQSITQEKPDDEIVQNLYLAAYSRYPTEEELKRAVEYVASAEDRRAGLEDVYWSVLNSKEFIFNH